MADIKIYGTLVCGSNEKEIAKAEQVKDHKSNRFIDDILGTSNELETESQNVIGAINEIKGKLPTENDIAIFNASDYSY